MKGSVVRDMLRGLPPRDREAFRGALSLRPDGGKLLRVLDVLESDVERVDAALLKRLKLNRLEKFRHLNLLFDLLLSHVAGSDPAELLHARYKCARRMLLASRFDSAKELIQSALELAGQAGDHQAILDLFDLAEAFPKERKLDLDIRIQLRAGKDKEDIAVLRNLLLAVRVLKDAPNNADRKQEVEKLKQAAVRRANLTNLCPKAKHLYLKTVAISQALLSEFSRLISTQETLIGHIESHPEIVMDVEHELVREMAIWLNALGIVRDWARFYPAVAKIQEMKFMNPLANTERAYMLFPRWIGAAIETGDEKGGEMACKQFLALLDSPTENPFDNGFVTQCLYFCAYFYLAAAHYRMAYKLIGRMHRHKKAEW